MELPHLTLHLRQMERVGPRGPLLVLLAWAIVIAFRWSLSFWFPYYWEWLAEEGIILLGNFIVYYVLARAMAALVREGGAEPPAWYNSPLPSAAAVCGTALIALRTAIAPLLGLVCYIFFSVSSLGIAQDMFWPNLLFATVRLLHYTLAAACLQLALCNLPIARFLPVCFALAATLVAHWVFAPGNLPWEVWWFSGNAEWTTIVIGGGLFLLIGLQVLMVQASGAGEPGWKQVGIVIMLLGMPIALGVAGWLSNNISVFFVLGEITTVWQLVPLHAAYSLIFADVYPIMPHFADTGSPFALYGFVLGIGPGMLAKAIALVLALQFAALPLWWFAALRCLNAARGPIPRRKNYPQDFHLPQ
ncbi:hypothetical protein IIA79_02385 [bacterium]|nr:hypothetical protein [bacterium]